MSEERWSDAISWLARTLRDAIVRLWQEDIWPLLMSLGIFLALALPLLIVIAVLWWVDSTGWRPAGGFYKIGATSPPVMALALAPERVPGRHDRQPSDANDKGHDGHDG